MEPELGNYVEPFTTEISKDYGNYCARQLINGKYHLGKALYRGGWEFESPEGHYRVTGGFELLCCNNPNQVYWVDANEGDYVPENAFLDPDNQGFYFSTHLVSEHNGVHRIPGGVD